MEYLLYFRFISLERVPARHVCIFFNGQCLAEEESSNRELETEGGDRKEKRKEVMSEDGRGDSDARERVRGREMEGYKGILNYNRRSAREEVHVR